MTAEHERLQNNPDAWKFWGPYLSERQWGTVREDYSATGEAWDYFSHDQSHKRSYRWGEDGLLGISDEKQRLCFALALWNGEDPVLKERFFGLTGSQGNHGEDVKEYYFYLDSTPTHSYMKALYKYPQTAYPYGELVAENQRRDRNSLEYELLDTGVFDDNRYFDVFIEYVKAAPEDIWIQITIANRGPESKNLSVLPTLWFRNTWSWEENAVKPSLKLADTQPGFNVLEASHPDLGNRWLYCQRHGLARKSPILFTENETNYQAVFGADNATPYVKDAFHRYVIQGDTDAVNPGLTGTKASAHYTLTIASGGSQTIGLRLSNQSQLENPLGESFAATLAARQRDADDFYGSVLPFPMEAEEKSVQRQAFAGLLWSKQYFRFDVSRWLKGDPTAPPPPESRRRNRHWTHLDAEDIISMPDKWEYPWFAAWDTAFHCIPLAMV
ncbi:MAG: glucosidase, partial [Cyanobacteria bacterium J06626_26]